MRSLQRRTAQMMPTTYQPSDITQVVSLRLHAANPWVLDRLARWPNYYGTPAKTMIVDVGSESEFSSPIKDACQARGFRYLYVSDSGTYSQAVGRNAAAALVTTPLIFFNDVDCFGPRDLFERLAEQANALELAKHADRMVNLPVYHLTEGVTAAISDTTDEKSFAKQLRDVLARAPHSAANEVVEYISPLSNFFLCRSDFFDYVGGYNENFRGHGSEDFEFIIRFAQNGRYYPIPENVLSDRYNPLRDSFYEQGKRYFGFRRLGEVMSFSAETAGLRIAHLHHHRGANDSSWYSNRDVRRQRFEEQLTPFLANPSARLAYDWCPRDKSAVVVGVSSDDDCRAALNLRRDGYRLRGIRPDEYDCEELSTLVVFEEDRNLEMISAAVAQAKNAGRDVRWLSRATQSTDPEDRLPPNSYLAARLGLELEGASIERLQKSEPQPKMSAPKRLTRRFSKLTRDPHRFLRDSRFRLLRAASKAFVAKD